MEPSAGESENVYMRKKVLESPEWKIGPNAFEEIQVYEKFQIIIFHVEILSIERAPEFGKCFG